jgi:hypothetical protein
MFRLLFSETNLKVRQAVAATYSLKENEQLAQLEGIIECEKPNNRLYKFDGTLTMNNKTVSLSNKQVLLRVKIPSLSSPSYLTKSSVICYQINRTFSL